MSRLFFSLSLSRFEWESVKQSNDWTSCQYGRLHHTSENTLIPDKTPARKMYNLETQEMFYDPSDLGLFVPALPWTRWKDITSTVSYKVTGDWKMTNMFLSVLATPAHYWTLCENHHLAGFTEVNKKCVKGSIQKKNYIFVHIWENECIHFWRLGQNIDIDVAFSWYLPTVKYMEIGSYLRVGKLFAHGPRWGSKFD